MTRKSIWIAGITAICVASLIVVSISFEEVEAETPEKERKAPGEGCAHGHNNFACRTPQHKIDIAELQMKTDELEKRVAQLEKR